MYAVKRVPCLISTFFPCLIKPIGPNKTVSATAVPTFPSPSFPLEPRRRMRLSSAFKYSNRMLSSPALPIIPAFLTLVMVATAGAPFLTTTTSPTLRSSSSVMLTRSSSTAVFELKSWANARDTSVPSFRTTGAGAFSAGALGGAGAGAGAGGASCAQMGIHVTATAKLRRVYRSRFSRLIFIIMLLLYSLCLVAGHGIYPEQKQRRGGAIQADLRAKIPRLRSFMPAAAGMKDNSALLGRHETKVRRASAVVCACIADVMTRGAQQAAPLRKKLTTQVSGKREAKLVRRAESAAAGAPTKWRYFCARWTRAS